MLKEFQKRLKKQITNISSINNLKEEKEFINKINETEDTIENKLKETKQIYKKLNFLKENKKELYKLDTRLQELQTEKEELERQINNLLINIHKTRKEIEKIMFQKFTENCLDNDVPLVKELSFLMNINKIKVYPFSFNSEAITSTDNIGYFLNIKSKKFILLKYDEENPYENTLQFWKAMEMII
jgi:hypothetical protein